MSLTAIFFFLLAPELLFGWHSRASQPQLSHAAREANNRWLVHILHAKVAISQAKVAIVAKKLEIVQDKTQSEAERIHAVEWLVALRASQVSPQLFAAMGKEWDNVTLAIIHALGEIGDKQALEGLEAIVDAPKVRLPSQVATIMTFAINKLEKRHRKVDK